MKQWFAFKPNPTGWILISGFGLGIYTVMKVTVRAILEGMFDYYDYNQVFLNVLLCCVCLFTSYRFIADHAKNSIRTN